MSTKSNVPMWLPLAAGFGVGVGAAMAFLGRPQRRTRGESQCVNVFGTSHDEKRERERATAFLSVQCDRSGQSLLRSNSTYFGGVKNYKMIMTAAEIDAALQKVANCLNTQFVGEKIVICSILKGAYMFCGDLCRRLTRPYSLYFVEASSYAGQTQSDEVEVLSRIVPEKFNGRRIILLDELLDNGATMETMKQYLIKKLGIEADDVVKTVLFSKENDRRDSKLDADIVGIDDLPDLWLVGYGLDDDGTKRGWPVLFAKPKAPGIELGPDDIIFDESKGAEAERGHDVVRHKVRANLARPLGYRNNRSRSS
jgi:hypoxanthine phosphoribosyltransferase